MKIKRIEHIAIARTQLRKPMAVFENVFGRMMAYEEDLPSSGLSMYPVGETCLEFPDGKSDESGIRKWIAEKHESFVTIDK